MIPDQVLLQGTVRTFDPELRRAMPQRLERTARGITEAFGGQYELCYRLGYPCLVNDAAMSDMVRAAAREIVGEERVVMAPQVMGAEGHAATSCSASQAASSASVRRMRSEG